MSAAEAFGEAWRLYAKYSGGPNGDSMAYWDNVARECHAATERVPGPLTDDLLYAVIRELDRAGKHEAR